MALFHSRPSSSVVALAAGLLGGALVLPVAGWSDLTRMVIDSLPLAGLGVVGISAVISAMLARGLVALGSRGTTWDMVFEVLGGAMAGWLVCSLGCGTAAWIHEGRFVDAAVPYAIDGGIAGLFVGAPIGAIVGATFAIPVRAVTRASVSPSHDAADRALLVAGGWLLALGLPILGLSFAMTMVPLGHPIPRAVVIAPALIAVSLGALGAAVARVLLWRRSRWLLRVAAGQDPKWKVLAVSAGSDDEVLMPLLSTWPANASDSVLVEVSDAPSHYRSPEKSHTPRALVRVAKV